MCTMHTDTVPEVASIVHKMSVYSVIETIHSSSAVDLVGYIISFIQTGLFQKSKGELL